MGIISLSVLLLDIQPVKNSSVYLQGAAEKNAQSFTHDTLGTICRKKIFATKCSGEITVYQSKLNIVNELNILW